MLTSRCNCYVAFLVANNTFSNNFKYPHAWKSQNSFGRIKRKSFYGNGIAFLRLSYFPSKNHREFELFLLATEISKSDFFAITTQRISSVNMTKSAVSC